MYADPAMTVKVELVVHADKIEIVSPKAKACFLMRDFMGAEIKTNPKASCGSPTDRPRHPDHFPRGILKKVHQNRGNHLLL